MSLVDAAPPAADAPDNHAAGSAERAQMTRKHVFCVNGMPAFLDVLRELFQMEHFNVTTTNYVPNTQAMIEALAPDLVLIDLEVGVNAGWELLEALARTATTHGVPVVITSTNQNLLDTARADPTRYGGSAYVIKPLDIDELLVTVRDLIGPA